MEIPYIHLINSKMNDCEFCGDDLKVLKESKYSFAFYDRFPVSHGHTLIIPKDHNETYFDLPVEVRNDCIVRGNETKVG